MGRVVDRAVAISYCIETSLNVPSTTWYQTERNTITSLGAQITTVSREPINLSRQRKKGTVVDLDSGYAYETDFTISEFRNFVEGYLFSVGINTDVTQLMATGAETTDDTYTGLTALTLNQADKFDIDTLIWVTGGAVLANNGLKTVDADILTGATAISVEEDLVDESADFRISFAGFRIPSTTTVSWTWDAANKQATLSSTGLVATLQNLGLNVSQCVHFGSVTTIGGSVQNGFSSTVFGYARVRSFSGTDDVIFDKVDTALQASVAAPTGDLDIVFAEFIRNVFVGTENFLERSYQFEATFPNLGDGTSGNTDQAYIYPQGNYANTISFSLPLSDKAGLTYGFIGTDTPIPTTTRKPNAANAIAQTQVQALSTASDIARLRITDVDEDGLTTDFKSLNLTVNNNVGPGKILGVLGADYMNYGSFAVNIEGEILFTNPLVIEAIREYQTLSMDFIVNNDDGVVCFDLPSMTLGDGSFNFPLNEAVTINVNGRTFEDSVLRTSIGVSIMPVPLPRRNFRA